jgi:alkylation response protein AidB-like acyl-CoA dehydrogenase
MTYDEPEHIALLRHTIRRFVDEKVPKELVRRCDREKRFPRDLFRELSALGVCGLTIPEQYGGSGVDLVAAIAVIDELCRRGWLLAGPFIHCAFYGGINIAENGDEEQKRKLLPRLAAGDLLFAYGLSEPDVGGDLASVSTRATLSGDGRSVRINGTKRWVTGARVCDYIYCLVRSDEEAGRYQNLSFVLVPPDAPGIAIHDIDHLGLRYAETTDVIFDDVEVPAENIVGGPSGWNRGWGMLVGPGLDVERLEISAVAYGIAAAAVDEAWEYAQQREQFGRKISAHQSVRHKLVDARTQLAACCHMLYHAAWLANEGRDCSVESSMAKLFIGEACVEIVLACQQVLGAYGCAEGHDMERHVRDLVCIPIVGGSSNMQRNNIAKRLKLAE